LFYFSLILVPSAYGILPFRSLDNSVLQVGHHFEDSLGQLARTCIFDDGDLVRRPVEVERLDGGDNGGSSGAERLIHSVVINGPNQVLDLEWSD